MKPDELRSLIHPQLAKTLGVVTISQAYAIAKRIRYRPSDFFLEFFNTPERTLRERKGDCDDIAILLTSLLRGIGYNAYVRIIALPDGTFHAFTYLPPDLALDPTVNPRPVNVFYMYAPYRPVLDFNDREVRVYDEELARRILVKTFVRR